jgi:hypothetical protein
MFAKLTAIQLVKPRAYAKKRAEKTTPINVAPEMAREVPSLVDDDDVGVGPDLVEDDDLDTVDDNPVGRTDPEAVGRPAKRTELVCVTQLDERGIRGFHVSWGIGPRLSGG